MSGGIGALYFVFALFADACLVAMFIIYTPQAVLHQQLQAFRHGHYNIAQDLVDLMLLACVRLTIFVPFYGWARARYSTRRSVILSLIWIFINFLFVLLKEVVCVFAVALFLLHPKCSCY